MSNATRFGMIAGVAIAALLAAGVEPFAQAGLPNPYRPVKGLADGGGPSIPGGEWARLPGGREMGPPASVYVDIDGESIWAFIRCDETSPVPVAAGGRFGLDCLGPDNKIKNHRHDLQVRREGQRRQELWRRHVHLASWAPCRPRGQCVGDRRGDRARCRDGRQGRSARPAIRSSSSARTERC